VAERRGHRRQGRHVEGGCLPHIGGEPSGCWPRNAPPGCFEQVQRQAAEQLAAERKAWISDLQLALRAIEASNPASAIAVAEVTADRREPPERQVTAAQPAPARTGWWRRR